MVFSKFATVAAFSRARIRHSSSGSTCKLQYTYCFNFLLIHTIYFNVAHHNLSQATSESKCKQRLYQKIIWSSQETSENFAPCATLDVVIMMVSLTCVFIVLNIDCLIRLLILIKQLYLSGIWLDVDPRTDTKRRCFSRGIGLHAQYIITIKGPTINIIKGT